MDLVLIVGSVTVLVLTIITGVMLDKKQQEKNTKEITVSKPKACYDFRVVDRRKRLWRLSDTDRLPEYHLTKKEDLKRLQDELRFARFQKHGFDLKAEWNPAVDAPRVFEAINNCKDIIAACEHVRLVAADRAHADDLDLECRNSSERV